MAHVSNIEANNTSYGIRATAIPYGVVDSTSTSTKYTATVPGITELTDGVCCLIKNGKVTSESGFTLNVNGLGAKPSYSNMATGNTHTPTAPTRDTTIFNINYTMLFIYTTSLPDVPNGAWICYRGYDANTNTIGYQVRSNSHSLPASQKFYRYRLLFTSADGTHYVPANTSSSTNATASRSVNQTPIDPFGHIVYYGTTAAVEANAKPAASSLWVIYTLSLGYSFNRTGAALTLDDWAPVYLKCAPQSNGSAIIDETTPYVQALPTTADGKIYIFLGVAYNATSIELLNSHPVYYHDGTGIRIWTGKTIPSKTSELTNDSGFQTKQQTLLYINTLLQDEPFEFEELPTFYDDSNNVVANSQVKALFDDPSKDVVLAVKKTDWVDYIMYRMAQRGVNDPFYIFHSTLGEDPSKQRTLWFQFYDDGDWTWSSYILDISLMIQDNVPTKVSDLTNDSGFITSSSLNGYATESYVDNKVPFIANVTISTNTSTGTVTASSITTHAQIKEAVAAGRSVYVKTSIGTVLHLMHINNDEAHFSIVGESSGWMMQQISCTSSNVWSVVNSGLATVATSGSYNDLTNKPTLLTTQKTILYASGTTQNLSFTNSSNASLVRDQVVDLLNNVGNDILLFLTNPIDSVTYPYIFTEKVSDTRWKLQLLSDTKYGHVTLDSGRGNNIVTWENVLNTIPTVDSSLTGSSQTNPVQGGAIYSALAEKAGKIMLANLTLNYDANDNEFYTCDKTYAQIYAALSGGQLVLMFESDYYSQYLYPVEFNVEGVRFRMFTNNSWEIFNLYINSDEEIGFQRRNIYDNVLGYYVPISRKINNKPLSTDITLTASDVGADVFVVTITLITNNGTTTYSADKTVAQIYAAWQAGRYIVCTDGDGFWNLSTCRPYSASFTNVNWEEINIIDQWVIYTEGSTQSVNVYHWNTQERLVSGTNIKTVNNQSLLGSGNLTASDVGAMSTSHPANAITSVKIAEWDAKADPVPIVTVSTTGAVTQALDPNKFYNFTGSPTSLTLTLNSGTGLCIYAGKFTAGTGFSNLTLPSTVKVADGAPSVEAGGVYEFSVMDNLLLLAKES